jgi:hypothetical protein
MPDPITIYTLSRNHADADGGQVLMIEGDFSLDLGKPMFVHIGPAGDTTDPKCVSGVAGQATLLYPVSTRKLRCFFPMLTPGGHYNVYVRREDMTRATLIPAVVTVLPRMYYSSVFDIRTVLPPDYRTGPRNMDALGAL